MIIETVALFIYMRTSGCVSVKAYQRCLYDRKLNTDGVIINRLISPLLKDALLLKGNFIGFLSPQQVFVAILTAMTILVSFITRATSLQLAFYFVMAVPDTIHFIRGTLAAITCTSATKKTCKCCSGCGNSSKCRIIRNINNKVN